MKRGFRFGIVFLSLILIISLFSFVVAEDEKDFEDCDAYCDDFWMSAMPACPGEKDTSGVYPDCECGWKCDACDCSI